MALVSTAAAFADDGDGASAPSRFQVIDASSVGLGDGISHFVPASLSDKPVSVMLKMSGAPVALRGQLSPAEKASVRAELKANQDGISKDIAKAGGTVVGQVQDAYNGVLVHAAQKDLPALASIPGVTEIQPVGHYAVPTNVNGVPLIKATQAWAMAGNYTGQNVNIAILDTGIDFTHADFGGAGTPAAYTAARAVSTQPPLPNEVGPTAPKVKKGWDFVGDDYNANVAGSVPVPDPNPLDCAGHGSHVAGTAAGFGVTADGHTYTGAYNASTVSSNSWLVGPGAAPKANIYAYRVFGCAGSTDVVILAINRAVADGADIISMSLGSPFGTSDQNDAEMTAVNNAVAAGLTVVAASGNNGQNAYITSAPASANHGLSVAAIDGSVPTYPGGLFSTTPAVAAINANGAPFAPSLTGKVRVLRDASQPGGISLGCDPNQYAGSTGMIVVVQRGTCARVARAIYGQKAGAAAVVMINSSAGLPPFEGQITSNPDTGEAYTVTIPFFGVNGPVTSADAQALVAADGQTVTVTPTTVPNTGYLRSASFTSGGPRNGDSAAKPEVSAPGVSVSSVLVGGGTKSTVMSGTSMATPMTSGVAALVKQAHPTWKGDQIKAALVNTADSGAMASGAYNGRINGTGLIQADKAVDNNALATTADGLDSLSFGYVSSSTGGYTATKQFSITNYGSSSVTYNLSASTNLPTVTTSVPSVTVAPGATANVDVTLSITAAQFAALATASPGFGAISTYRGLVTATPAAGSPSGFQRLRLQWLAAPRGLSDIKATAPAAFVKQSTNNVYTSSTTVSNAGIHSGGADFYAWGIKDAKDLSGNAGQDIRDAGVQSFPNGTIVFAVNGWNASSTQATQEYDIPIDLQHNGKADWVVVGADFGAVTTGTFDGRFAAFLFNAKTNAVGPHIYVADAPMNGSTALLPVAASDLGLQAANSSFNYTVNGFSIFGGPVDTTSIASYDTAKPGVATGMFESLAPGQSASVPLWADYDKLQSAPALGWLVVNTDDLGGPASAEEVTLGALK